MISWRSLLFKVILIVAAIALCLPGYAGKNDNDKEFKTGKVLQIQIAQAAPPRNGYIEPTAVNHNPYAGVETGSTSVLPASYSVIFAVLLDTGEETITMRGSFEDNNGQPDIKGASELQYRLRGSDRVQVLDRRNRKFEFKVMNREPKPPAAQATSAASSTPQK